MFNEDKKTRIFFSVSFTGTKIYCLFIRTCSVISPKTHLHSPSLSLSLSLSLSSLSNTHTHTHTHTTFPVESLTKVLLHIARPQCAHFIFRRKKIKQPKKDPKKSLLYGKKYFVLK